MTPNAAASSAVPIDVLADWRGDVAIHPVLSGGLQGHSLHTYFGVSPESPDERWVLVYTSDRPDAQVGRLVVVERGTGHVRTLDDAVEVEDGHRQANQQWVCGGRYVVYMTLTDGEWHIVRVDINDLSKTVLAKGRQLGWGQPHLDLVPLYGVHWAPGDHRDIELLDVRTGEIRIVLTAEQVIADDPAFVYDKLGFGKDEAISLFFPTLSPDGQRVFVKLSAPDNGRFRSPKASRRLGLIVYDLRGPRLLARWQKWGHPAWYSDSRHIQQLGCVMDVEGGKAQRLDHLPSISGAHASPAPGSRLIVTDVFGEDYLGADRCWGIVVAPVNDSHSSEAYHVLHVAPATGHGTRSWRPAHPHPAFNAAGNRIYFNVMMHDQTVLHVAEIQPDRK